MCTFFHPFYYPHVNMIEMVCVCWWIWLSISNILRSVYIWPDISNRGWFCLPISNFFIAFLCLTTILQWKLKSMAREKMLHRTTYNPFGICVHTIRTMSDERRGTVITHQHNRAQQRLLSGLIWKAHRAKCVFYVWQWMEQKRKETTNSMQRIKRSQPFAFAPSAFVC